MFWMLLGVGTLVCGGNTASIRGDSAALADLRNHLPRDLRERVEKVRELARNRHDTLAHLSPSGRIRWTDSLEREVLKRRTQALDTLAPAERRRIEDRMHDIELQSGTRPRPPRLRDPGLGLPQ
jgi:hypothetical protein